jgi:hypothetical protein
MHAFFAVLRAPLLGSALSLSLSLSVLAGLDGLPKKHVGRQARTDGDPADYNSLGKKKKRNK